MGIGLVFGGGGGKGAYQIGVWKTLIEKGLDKHITCISGTSIGGLNLALFIQGDYNKAYNIWSELSNDKILEVDVNKIFNIFFEALGKKNIKNKLKYLIESIGEEGVFSRAYLTKIINSKINLNYISNSKIPCYITCCNIPEFDAKYFNLQKREHNYIKKLLLATSAFPIAFDVEIIEGKMYTDGGMAGIEGNIPLYPLYTYENIKNMIVVKFDKENILKNNISNTNIIEISPSENLGNLFKGTLNFNPNLIKDRINLGYKDSLRILNSNLVEQILSL